ncbi:MAG: hypothetical protein GY780_00345 [bacterium]|nr:hypothetical protein [bacterium]
MKTRYCLFLISFLFVASVAMAEVVTTISLDNLPAVACDEVFLIEGIECYFTSTTAEDCDGGGNCEFDVSYGTWPGMWLFPGRFVVDLGETYAINRVEVDIWDWCGVGCTAAFLYDNGANVGSGSNSVYGEDTITVVPSGNMASSFAVSSCEGQFFTIRIYSDTVATDESEWDQVKSLYR